MKQKIKAFTLIELLLVVSIILALGSMTVYIMFSKVRGHQRVDIEEKNIQTLHEGVRTLYSINASFSTVNNATIINSNTVVARMRLAPNSTELVNQFGGVVTIDADTLGNSAPTGNVFKITWGSVPDYECVYIARDLSEHFAQVGINGNQGTSLVKPFESGKKVSIEDAGAVCNAGVNTMYFWSR